jgi:transcriptional regulator NrdR family protein
MGLNLDLVCMFGLPTHANCPHCRVKNSLHFDDYDVECNAPQDGEVIRTTECSSCEKEFTVTCKLKVVEVSVTA